ncbi:alpha/beta fold hydrolase [Streptomyces sp. NRRL S-1022]|uniref:alpha/beta fold hydrolase n=1 Tax=Streptomyces sp. NRRL S-1022 TaxID=1463880 RepID=UPI0004C17FD4|nr:alpha/beta hydrolase [Streptomyces sp. NRRL S-1022]
MDPSRRLAEALVDADALVRAVPGLRVASTPGAPLTQVRLDSVTGQLGLPRLEVVADPDGLWSVELALTRHLARASAGDGTAAGPAGQWRTEGPVPVRATDGTALRCWSAGPPDAPVVALVTACGMPAGLTAGWMRALAGPFRVVTWESRGMFGAPDADGPAPLGAHDVASQAGDLLAVLDALDVPGAHVMGLCGGAVLALAAAATAGPRVSSLSLWHGDYDLGDAAPRTEHQRDMQAMMAMAARGPEKAAGVHRLMRRPVVLDSLRPDIAHHLIYPYATPLLLHRYGLLNGAIMSHDSRPYLSAAQPVLVVTSRDDVTAHPAGSRYVAAHLPRARLVTRPSGDHLTAFDAGPEVVRLAERFLSDVLEDA